MRARFDGTDKKIVADLGIKRPGVLFMLHVVMFHDYYNCFRGTCNRLAK